MRESFQDTELAGAITRPSVLVGDDGQDWNQAQASRTGRADAGGPDTR